MSSLKSSQLTPGSIGENWSWVSPILLELGGGLDPLHVRREVEEGKAWFLLGQGQEFVILKGARRQYSEEPHLLVWFGWSKSGNAIERYWADIQQIGRDADFKFIEFWSDRKGFSRIAEKMGLKPDMTIYRGEI